MKTYKFISSDETKMITTLDCDISTDYKDLKITQQVIGSQELNIQLNTEDDYIKLGDIILTGLEKKLFLEFVNQ